MSDRKRKIYESYRTDILPCVWCSNKLHKTSVMATVEHIIPKWINKDNSWNNTRIACFSCNTKRGQLTEIEALTIHLRIGKINERSGERYMKAISGKNLQESYEIVLSMRNKHIDWGFIKTIKKHPLHLYYMKFMLEAYGLVLKDEYGTL